MYLLLFKTKVSWRPGKAMPKLRTTLKSIAKTKSISPNRLVCFSDLLKNVRKVFY